MQCGYGICMACKMMICGCHRPRPLHVHCLSNGRRPQARPLRWEAPAARCRAAVQNIQAQTVLERLGDLDSHLAKEGEAAEAAALQLVTSLKEQGLLRAFGGARQVPKRQYTLEDLRLNRIEPQKFLSPTDNTLTTVRTVLQGGGLLALTAAFFGLHWELSQLLTIMAALGFLITYDQVANAGGLEALTVDTAGRYINSTYGDRVAAHEAGHFLIAYLVGLLPRTYTLSSLDALRRYNTFNVQAGTLFCDSAYQREVASGTLSSASLDRYSSVALAGVATEYVRYGQAEGGLNDIQQLDGLLRALQFTEKKAAGQIRWAVLNVTTLLRRHSQTHAELAKAMAAGKSVADCIAVIEATAPAEDEMDKD